MENHQERDQHGTVRPDEEEIVWRTGNLPELIGNNKRDRLNSKRIRSWGEDEDRDSRRPRS